MNETIAYISLSIAGVIAALPTFAVLFGVPGTIVRDDVPAGGLVAS